MAMKELGWMINHEGLKRIANFLYTNILTKSKGQL